MDKIIRWGMIGCGSVTEVKSGPAFNKVACSQLFGVMRRDAIKLKDYASRHTVPYFTTDANALINHPEIEAIYIATPPKYHQEYAIAAMNAGKHVYVEKPMALNVAACLSMKEAAEKLNAKLVIAHYRRELPLFMHVKKLIQEQAIGKVHSVNIIMHKYAKSKEAYATDWRVKPAIAGAGFFLRLSATPTRFSFFIFLAKLFHLVGPLLTRQVYMRQRIQLTVSYKWKTIFWLKATGVLLLSQVRKKICLKLLEQMEK